MKKFITIIFLSIIFLVPKITFANAGLSNISDSDVFAFFYVIAYVVSFLFTLFVLMLKSIFGKPIKKFRTILFKTLLWNILVAFIITMIIFSAL